MIPKKKIPNTPDKKMHDTIQDASSIVILPDGSGVSSLINKSMLGLAQPAVIPFPIVNRFTFEKENNQKLVYILH